MKNSELKKLLLIYKLIPNSPEFKSVIDCLIYKDFICSFPIVKLSGSKFCDVIIRIHKDSKNFQNILHKKIFGYLQNDYIDTDGDSTLLKIRTFQNFNSTDMYKLCKNEIDELYDKIERS